MPSSYMNAIQGGNILGFNTCKSGNDDGSRKLVPIRVRNQKGVNITANKQIQETSSRLYTFLFCLEVVSSVSSSCIGFVFGRSGIYSLQSFGFECILISDTANVHILYLPVHYSMVTVTRHNHSHNSCTLVTLLIYIATERPITGS